MMDISELVGGLRSYSSPFNVGHKALEGFWDGRVIVQEKIDGSQFSFGLRNGQVICRSRKLEINPADAGMFHTGVGTAHFLFAHFLLREGWTYRAEFLQKPKQNTLVYERVPNRNIILFDVDQGDQDYLGPHELAAEAERIGLEVVPLLAEIEGTKPTLDDLLVLLGGISILGGPLEGIVLKNYALFGVDKKVLMAKLVSKDFQETHRKDWAGRNPSDKDFVHLLSEEYANPVRWAKAVQHLREQGLVQGAPQDIPIIMKEIAEDVEQECRKEIEARLFAHFWTTIRRQLTKGFPEFYKNRLVEESLGISEVEKSE